MATAYSYTRDGILDGLAADRESASYAARPQVTDAARAQVMAKDLVNALDRNDTTEAKRLALALRPMLGLLEGN